MIVYITKYALTKGIVEAEGVEKSVTMIAVKGKFGDAYYHNNEWHTNKGAAIEMAKRMQNRRIASLQKSMESVKKLKFD